MRLANGIVVDKEKTFGMLKFSALRREVHLQNEDGSVSPEIKERTYDLKSRTQGRMIQVSVPASVPLKEFEYNAEVELINPVVDTVANANYRGADVDWYIKADDIILKNKQSGRKADGSATAGATRVHDRPVTASSGNKNQTTPEKRERPVVSERVHTQNVTAQPVKRPLSSGIDRKNPAPIIQKASRSSAQTSQQTEAIKNSNQKQIQKTKKGRKP